MNTLRDFLLYGSLDKETYDNIKPRIHEENRKVVSVFTILGSACFLLTAFAAMIGNENVPVPMYFLGIGVFLLMNLLNRFGYKKFPVISDFFAILYSALLMAAGVFLAYSQSSERTTLLLPFYALVSLVFCYRPIYLMLILMCTQCAYLFILHDVQSENLYFINLINTCIFCFVGMVGGFYTLVMKHSKYKAEYENQILLEKDILTGVYNRYSCKMAFDKIAEINRPVLICSFDINGLKQVNDTKGHIAGDELIKGAAECLTEVFGQYGNVYRIGGDEFCVLIYDQCNEEDLRKALDEKTKSWKGKLSDELSIAFGMSRIDSDFENLIAKVVHEADIQMFDEKRKYYKEHDRRHEKS